MADNRDLAINNAPELYTAKKKFKKDVPAIFGDFLVEHDSAKSRLEFHDLVNDAVTYIPEGNSGELPGSGSGSGDAWSVTNQTADYTASNNDSVWADSSSAAVTITLPSPSTNDHVRVVNVDNTNGVTLSENGTEGINDQSGSNSTISLAAGESITVESDGSTWWVV